MTSYRIGMFLAALAAAVASPVAPPALADGQKDELAEGDWTGEKEWDHLEPGGAASDPPPATPATPPPSTGGTSTPPDSGDEPSGTPTEPTDQPPTGEGGVADPTGEPEPEPEPEPAPPPPSVPPLAPATTLPSCNSYWVCEVEPAAPSLYEKKTMLTVTLFRTDAFAFVSNGYCRSESTWYVDWFATTEAKHSDFESFSVTVRLEHPCPNCKPRISLLGVSMLDSRAQVKTSWGGVDASSKATSGASTSWAGDIDCSDSCSASVVSATPTAQVGIELGPIKATLRATGSCIYVEAPGGKSRKVDIQAARTDLMIVNKGSVATFAGGTEDNSQAKSRAAYALRILGEAGCGAWGQYDVNIRK
jgi:hypothetical protein